MGYEVDFLSPAKFKKGLRGAGIELRYLGEWYGFGFNRGGQVQPESHETPIIYMRMSTLLWHLVYCLISSNLCCVSCSMFFHVLHHWCGQSEASKNGMCDHVQFMLLLSCEMNPLFAGEQSLQKFWLRVINQEGTCTFQWSVYSYFHPGSVYWFIFLMVYTEWEPFAWYLLALSLSSSHRPLWFSSGFCTSKFKKFARQFPKQFLST